MAKTVLPHNNPPDENVLAKRQKRRRQRKEKKKRQHSKLQDSSISSTVEAEERAFTCPEKSEYDANSKAGSDCRSLYSTLWQQYTPAQTTLIKGADWYSQRTAEKPTPKVLVDLPIRQKLKALATEIYKTELQQFEKFEENNGSREVRFRRQILRHGVAKDRVAAHLLRLTEAPLHSLQHLASVLSLLTANKDSLIKDVSKSLEDVLGSALLPRCLVAKPFEQHDFQGVLPNLIRNNIRKAETQLLIWYFEDQLRLQYLELLKTLQEILKNSNEGTKLKAVQLLLHLIGNHPNQETEFIIQMLVNKLGDLEKPVAIAVVYGLRNLLNRRPALKGMVVDTCAEFLYRANQRGNTYLNCMLLLKDVLYTRNDGALAQKMVKLYFGFFKACIKKGEVDGKLMSVILRGLNRVLPFLTGQQGPAGADFLLDQMDTLYRMAHLVTNFGITVQLLQLLYQVQAAVLLEGPLTERFHRMLYSQLLSPDLGRSSCAAPFLNIIFKTMNRLENPHTFKAFAKRLLQVAAYQPTHVSIAMLFILSEVCADHPLFVAVMDGLEEVPKQELSEENAKPDFEELLGQEPESVVNPLVQRGAEEDDDEEEYFEDLDVGPDGIPVQAKSQTNGLLTNVALGQDIQDGETTPDQSAPSKKLEKKSALSWLHRANQRDQCKQEVRATKYDPHHRNPTYCGVQHAPIWELRNAVFHFHPSMAAFTTQLINHEPFNYSGDPLIDFSFMKFLDRFIYKNPKKPVSEKKSGGARALGAKAQYCGQSLRNVNVATDYFKKLKEASVPEDVKFFHKYFTTYKNIKSRTRKQKKTADDAEESLADDGDIDDDEFDEYLQTLGDQKKYKDDDEFDDEWDFAAKAKRSAPDNSDDSDGDDFPEDECDDDYVGGDDDEDDLDMEEENGQEIADDDESLGDDDDMGLNEDGDDDDESNDSNDFDNMLQDSEEELVESKNKDLKPSKRNSKKGLKSTLDTISKKGRTSSKSDVMDGDKKTQGSTSLKKRKQLKIEAMEAGLEGEEDDDWASLSGDSDDGRLGFNEEDVSFSEDDDNDDYGFQKTSKTKKRKNDGFMDLTAGLSSRKRVCGPRSLESMMMDADEFSAMLQENETRAPAVTSDAFVNTGKTSMKQLKWEEAQAAGQRSRKRKAIPEKFQGKTNAKTGSKSKKKWRK